MTMMVDALLKSSVLEASDSGKVGKLAVEMTCGAGKDSQVIRRVMVGVREEVGYRLSNVDMRRSRMSSSLSNIGGPRTHK